MSVFICLLSLLTWPIKSECFYASCALHFGTNCYWWGRGVRIQNSSSRRSIKSGPKESQNMPLLFDVFIVVFLRSGERAKLWASLDQLQENPSLIGSVSQHRTYITCRMEGGNWWQCGSLPGLGSTLRIMICAVRIWGCFGHLCAGFNGHFVGLKQ